MIGFWVSLRTDCQRFNPKTWTLLGEVFLQCLAVEFIFPTTALLCYERFDCTGQQLINLAFVLINGERVSLDLQSAER